MATLEQTDEDRSERPDEPAYEAPRIAWREPYTPLVFGISCAKQPGNPACNPGPTSS